MDRQDTQAGFHFFIGLTCVVLVVAIQVQRDVTRNCFIIGHPAH